MRTHFWEAYDASDSLEIKFYGCFLGFGILAMLYKPNSLVYIDLMLKSVTSFYFNKSQKTRTGPLFWFKSMPSGRGSCK